MFVVSLYVGRRLCLLAMFARLPRSLINSTRPLQLARDGFFYVGRHRVRCFLCGVEVTLLGGLESSPQELHRVSSPQCPPADVHPSSEALLRDVLHWMPLSVEIRRQNIQANYLHINFR